MLDFFFPRFCAACGRRLTEAEKHLCCGCIRGLPRTNYHLMEISPLEQVFWGQVPIERATAMFFYNSTKTNNVIYQLKYLNNPKAGMYVAQLMASEIADSGFFQDIDIIVPVPLSWRKKLIRGYNQCDWIAKGISKQTGIPIVFDAIKRAKHNTTQTVLDHQHRWDNVNNIFRLAKAELVAGKHILIVDDVITTGATTISCMKELMKAGKGTRFSVLSIAKAGTQIFSEPRLR